MSFSRQRTIAMVAAADAEVIEGYRQSVADLTRRIARQEAELAAARDEAARERELRLKSCDKARVMQEHLRLHIDRQRDSGNSTAAVSCGMDDLLRTLSQPA